MRKRDDTAKTVAIVAALLFMSRALARAAPGPSPGPVNPPSSKGGEVAPVRTALGMGSADWHRARYALARSLGLSVDAAISVTAHWSIETNMGASEWNFNLGGIKARPGQQYVNLHASEGGTASFAAYDSATDGAASYLGLLMNHYRACYDMLVSGQSPDWYVCLQKHGYFTAQTDAALIMTQRRDTVARDVGAPA